MKNKIIGLMVGIMIITPVFAGAQSVPPDTQTLQDALTAALQTVIGLLQQEVQLLTTQLAEKLQQISDNQTAITTNQTALTTQVQQIAQLTLPTTTQPVFGGLPVIPPTPLSSSIKIDLVSNDSSFPISQWTTDQDSWQFATVTLDASLSQKDVSVGGIRTVLKSDGNNGDLKNCHVYGISGVQYTTPGGSNGSEGTMPLGFQDPLQVNKGTIIDLSIKCNVHNISDGKKYYLSLDPDMTNWRISNGDNTIGSSVSTVTENIIQ